MKKPPKPTLNIVLWSGGKDSTATIILAHLLGIKIDLIIMSLIWFDKEGKIYAIDDDHLDWIMNYAKPLFESWGYKVEFVDSEKDYLYYFFFKRQWSKKHPETVGKYYGFPIAGNCRIQRLKVEPITKRLKELRKQYKIVEYAGICSDETERIENMNRRRQVSILEKEGYTQKMTRALCEEYGLLSPRYDDLYRDGCWFCPNQSIKELARLKTKRPDRWERLRALSKVENTIARGFAYGRTFEEIERKVDEYIANPPPPPPPRPIQLEFDFSKKEIIS